MLYRLLKPLSFGERIVPIGTVKRLGLDAKDIRRLLDKGAIVPVNMPPLSEIPLWEDRAAKLLKIGILDADQFLDEDSKVLARHLGVKPSAIEAWKTELVRWITPAEKAGGCNCKKSRR